MSITAGRLPSSVMRNRPVGGQARSASGASAPSPARWAAHVRAAAGARLSSRSTCSCASLSGFLQVAQPAHAGGLGQRLCHQRGDRLGGCSQLSSTMRACWRRRGLPARACPADRSARSHRQGGPAPRRCATPRQPGSPRVDGRSTSWPPRHRASAGHGPGQARAPPVPVGRSPADASPAGHPARPSHAIAADQHGGQGPAGWCRPGLEVQRGRRWRAATGTSPSGSVQISSALAGNGVLAMACGPGSLRSDGTCTAGCLPPHPGPAHDINSSSLRHRPPSRSRCSNQPAQRRTRGPSPGRAFRRTSTIAARIVITVRSRQKRTGADMWSRTGINDP